MLTPEAGRPHFVFWVSCCCCVEFSSGSRKMQGNFVTLHGVWASLYHKRQLTASSAARNHLWKIPTCQSWSKTRDMIMENLSPRKRLLMITKASGLGNLLKKWNRFKSVRENLVTKSRWLHTSEKKNTGRRSAIPDLLLMHIKTP